MWGARSRLRGDAEASTIVLGLVTIAAPRERVGTVLGLVVVASRGIYRLQGIDLFASPFDVLAYLALTGSLRVVRALGKKQTPHTASADCYGE